MTYPSRQTGWYYTLLLAAGLWRRGLRWAIAVSTQPVLSDRRPAGVVHVAEFEATGRPAATASTARLPVPSGFAFNGIARLNAGCDALTGEQRNPANDPLITHSFPLGLRHPEQCGRKSAWRRMFAACIGRPGEIESSLV